jgi:hypothetical protein
VIENSLSTQTTYEENMASFRDELHQQRWDDHRFYHHSLINQSLHFFSASTFVCCYVLLIFDPGIASFLAWTLAMASRQSGHFFFEPKGYDNVNQVTHEHKEDVKTGYNLFRKWILMSVWICSPAILLWSPTLFGFCKPASNWVELIRHVGYIWLVLGGGALLFRVAQLCIVRDVRTGLVWGAKILTDPFHDIKLYHNSPMRFLRGERYDQGLAPTE